MSISVKSGLIVLEMPVLASSTQDPGSDSMPCWSKTRNFVDISIGIPGVDILIWKMNAQFFAIFPDAKGNGPLSLLT